jgi:hypothetical protein
MNMNTVTVVTPTGCIGNRGIDKAALQRCILDAKPDAIAVDAGSLDCGPWYLGSGQAHSPRRNIEWDIDTILTEAVPAKIRVIIGSAGGSGAAAHVKQTIEIIERIAARRKLKFRLAIIWSDVSTQWLTGQLSGEVVEHAIHCATGAKLTRDDIEASKVVVGMMGTGPIIDALENGADVIVAGRAVDAAVIASYPIFRGCDPGLAYHMGDIMECAESCAEEIAPTLRSLGRNRIPIIGRISADAFELQPSVDTLACTPESCLMHSAYERTSFNYIKVPEGTIDRSHAIYEAVDRNTTRISGSRFVAEPHSILLEGVRHVGYRSIFPIAIRTPAMLRQLDEILSSVDNIQKELFGSEGDFKIHWHKYGDNAVLQSAETMPGSHEVGILADVVAASQDLAHDVAYDLLTRLGFWRYPGRYTTAGNIAVTLSPGIIDAGEVFEFSIYHAMKISDDREIFRTELINVG